MDLGSAQALQIWTVHQALQNHGGGKCAGTTSGLGMGQAVSVGSAARAAAVLTWPRAGQAEVPGGPWCPGRAPCPMAGRGRPCVGRPCLAPWEGQETFQGAEVCFPSSAASYKTLDIESAESLSASLPITRSADSHDS